MAGTKYATLYATDVRRSDQNEVWFRFALKSAGVPKLEIRDLNDVLTKTLDLGQDLPPGEYASRGRAYFWDKRDTGGSLAAPGVYTVRLYFDSVFQTQGKFVLL